MCNRKNQEKSTENLADYYSADYDKVLEEIYGPVYHENGFDHKATPIITAEQPKRLVLYNWGFDSAMGEGSAGRAGDAKG